MKFDNYNTFNNIRFKPFIIQDKTGERFWIFTGSLSRYRKITKSRAKGVHSILLSLRLCLSKNGLLLLLNFAYGYTVQVKLWYRGHTQFQQESNSGLLYRIYKGLKRCIWESDIPHINKET